MAAMPISTPCTKVCILDRRTGLCEGCGRTGEEILRWINMSEADRLAVMALLPERMALAFGPTPALHAERAAP
jgi:hypothetical protein